MGKGPDKVEETPQERALAEHARNVFDDYKRRWLPVQLNLAEQIKAMGAPDSMERKQAAGKASTDVAIKFAGAQGALEKSLSNSGVGVGSSRGKLAVAGMGDDRARSTGLSTMISDQQVDDAYTRGLTALMMAGRGERATVGNALADQAQQSARQATADAEASLLERQGQYQLAGQFAGLGLQQAITGYGKTPPVGSGSNPNGYQGTVNNPSAFVATPS